MTIIVDTLRTFDGRHVAELESLASRLLPGEESVDELITLSCSDHHATAVGATWLLKRMQEMHTEFSKQQVKQVIQLLLGMSNWEPKLHLLQMLGEFDIPADKTEELFLALKQNLKGDNKFVRAWSYNGLFVVGAQHPRYSDEVSRLLDGAESDPAASVRARVRKLKRSAAKK